jgi:hypothetical protein
MGGDLRSIVVPATMASARRHRSSSRDVQNPCVPDARPMDPRPATQGDFTMSDPLVLAVDGPPIAGTGARDVIADALGAGAAEVVIPVARLDPGFFDLRTGIAGDIVQAFVTYGLRLVVVGDLPPEARSSRAFSSFVREANRGAALSFRPA